MASCEKQSNQATFIEVGVDITFLDKDGNDLLNPANPNALTEDDMDLYFLINGEKVKQYNPDRTAPKGLWIADETRDGKYFVVVPTNSIELDENNRAIAYLKFSDGTEDKIESEYKTYENSYNIQIMKLWYNDKLEWDYETDEGIKERWVIVVKN